MKIPDRKEERKLLKAKTSRRQNRQVRTEQNAERRRQFYAPLLEKEGEL